MHQTNLLVIMTFITIAAIFTAPIVFSHAALMAVIVVFLVTIIYLVMLLICMLFTMICDRIKHKV